MRYRKNSKSCPVYMLYRIRRGLVIEMEKVRDDNVQRRKCKEKMQGENARRKGKGRTNRGEM
jgi:hypothetical protein